MNPNIIYLAAYTAIIDEKLYEAEWLRIKEIIATQNLGDEVKNEVMRIFGDDEKRIQCNTVIDNLHNISYDEKQQTVSLALAIALSDGFISKKCNEFISGVAHSIGVLNYDEIKMQMMSLVRPVEDDIEETRKRYGAGFYKFLSKVMPDSLKDKLEEQYRKCLLSGVDYTEAIEKMRSIAHADIDYARKSFNAISDKMKTASLKLQNSAEKILNSTSDMESDTGSDIDSLNGFLSDLCRKNSQYINDIRDKAAVSLSKKEEALQHYTISFMGRTKAGKSTLHSIILGGNDREFIGVGKERTTRYNRVYQWNGIRIIDTPGIGAPGGKHDEQIASEIIDETDLICYMVTSDGVQETEFKFLKGIKDQNKPVIILLNMKDNFERTPGKRQGFLDNPLAWYNDEGKDSISGHVNRITEYTSKYYRNANIEICPVQLLAAKVSQDCSDESEKECFYRGSRLQAFLDDIRICILNYGALKRSQTILDGTIFHFNNYKNDFSNQMGKLMDIEQKIQNNSITAIDRIHEAGQKAKKNIKNSIENLFDGFINDDLQKFAIANYYLDNDEIEEELSKYVASYDFNSRIKSICEIEVEKYKNEVDDILTTFNENLSFDLDKFNFEDIDLCGVFDTRTLISILGSLAGIAALFVSGPLGIAVIVASIAAGFISRLFKTKEQRIKMAQDKLYSDLKEQFVEYRDKTVAKMTTESGNAFNKIEGKIEGLFRNVFDEIEKITEILDELKHESTLQYAELSKVYAARIVNFAADENVFNLPDEFEYRKMKVFRDFGKYMKIKTVEAKKYDTDEITKVLQEKITINENKQ